MSDRPLTPEEQRELLGRLEYVDGLLRGNPVAAQNDVLVKTWGQLIRIADALQALPKLVEVLEELMEIERSKEAKS